jgi:hypothetical protein
VLQLVALLLWQYSVALETRNWPQLPLRLLFVDHAELVAKSIAPLLQFIPEVQWGWIRDPANRSSLTHEIATWVLNQLHIGLLPALLGAALALIVVTVGAGQRGRIAAVRQHEQDRLRRVHEYRRQQQAVVPEPQMSRDEDDELIEAAERAWRRDRMQILRR